MVRKWSTGPISLSYTTLSSPFSRWGVDELTETCWGLWGDSGEPNYLTQLVEAFAVAMILFVRPALIEFQDMTQCLRRLMKFPPVEDVTVRAPIEC